MVDYETVLEIVAQNPGATIHEIDDVAAGSGLENNVDDLLEEAVNREDVVRFNGRYWIVRKEKYSFSEYDHPTP